MKDFFKFLKREAVREEKRQDANTTFILIVLAIILVTGCVLTIAFGDVIGPISP